MVWYSNNWWKTYNNSSEELVYNKTGWKWIPGGTIKSGVNYRINDKHNVYLNTGILNKPPLYNNVVDNSDNIFFYNIENQQVYAVEGGYSLRLKSFAMNVNGYYTYWINKPYPFGVRIADPADPSQIIVANINGMDALAWGLR